MDVWTYIPTRTELRQQMDRQKTDGWADGRTDRGRYRLRDPPFLKKTLKKLEIHTAIG